MTSPIGGIGDPFRATSTDAAERSLAAFTTPGEAESTPGFGEMLLEAIESTSALEHSANAAIEDHLTGGDVEMAEVFASVKKADLALRTMVQVRNKLLEAYDEIKQIRI